MDELRAVHPRIKASSFESHDQLTTSGAVPVPVPVPVGSVPSISLHDPDLWPMTLPPQLHGAAPGVLGDAKLGLEADIRVAREFPHIRTPRAFCFRRSESRAGRMADGGWQRRRW